MAMFSFNKPAGACPTCTGLGTIYAPDLARLLDEDKSILDGAVAGWDPRLCHSALRRDAAQPPGATTASTSTRRCPSARWARSSVTCCCTGSTGQPFQRHFPGVEPPATVAKGRFEGIVTTLLRRHAEHASDAEYLEKIERFLIPQTCPDCGGARLRPESRAVTVLGRHAGGGAQAIPEPSRLSRACRSLALAEWIDGLQRRAARRGLAHRRADRDRPARARSAPGGGGAGLPDPRTGHALALGGRGAAPAPGGAARLRADRRAVRAGRADHRAAPARHPAPDQHAARAARPGQHRAGHRARPGDDRRRPTGWSISAPARGGTAGRSWPRARRSRWPPVRNR